MIDTTYRDPHEQRLTSGTQLTTVSMRSTMSAEAERSAEAASRDGSPHSGATDDELSDRRDPPVADSPLSGRPVVTPRSGGRSAMRRTVFERYGGFAKVNRVVMSYYEKILDSPITSPYFEHVDMRQLIDHQTRFIATVMGGPASYTNDHLERVHVRHGITEGAFQEACNLLVETLEDHGFADEDIQIVVDEFVGRKHYIVTRS
jgi:hemoglobin